MENVIELAKQKDILTFMGKVTSDKSLPKNPKNGEMYIADCSWKSNKVNKIFNSDTSTFHECNNIYYDDVIIYSSEYGWVIKSRI